MDTRPVDWHPISFLVFGLFVLTGRLNQVGSNDSSLRSLDRLAWWYESCAGLVFALLLCWSTLPPAVLALGGLGGGLLLVAASLLRRDIRTQKGSNPRQ